MRTFLKMKSLKLRPFALRRSRVIGAGVLIAGAAVAAAMLAPGRHTETRAEPNKTEQPRRAGNAFHPTEKQWATLAVATVSDQVFRAEHLTEGKIAVDEDHATMVFSPYSGRVIRLMARPGEHVTEGQPLFMVESPDMVQAQNDFINAVSGLNKARSALDLAKIVEQQNKSLYETRAAPLRDVQQAQAGTLAATNDLRAAETSLEVARNRLKILGKTDEEINTFGDTGAIDPRTTIKSPIEGTVVQRRVGPGQYVNTTSNSTAANDATFVIGDLSTVWLVAYVRESEAPRVKVGQPIQFTVLAFPDRKFSAELTYVATSLDASTRRLLVRATIDNKDGLLRPEMFASVTILTSTGDSSPGVPREAIVYDGKAARVWVVRPDNSVEARVVTTGLSSGQMVQVLSGVRAGERIVTKGSLFVDRAAGAS